MFRINKETNEITQVEARLFGDLGFREREHLQEWIAKNPDALGEDLLIIQKEFSGFSDTNERLDLLALDKDKNLVVIENKLDDTGRDVVWQALKYVSYCSRLSTSQIVRIYQQYLDATGASLDARTSIFEFLEIEDDLDLVLNDKDQRIILVANHYRKEVTSTVLWLLDHEIQIQCFKATPYSIGDNLLLNMEQIIPVPEASEFIIDLKEKAKEDRGKSQRVAETEAQLLKFWKEVKAKLTERGVKHLDNVSPRPRYYLGFGSGRARFNMVIGRTAPRIELYFTHDEDKSNFDAIARYKEDLDRLFGGRLEWQRLEGKKASRVKYEASPAEMLAMGEWTSWDSGDAQVDWYVRELPRFYDLVFPLWESARSSS